LAYLTQCVNAHLACCRLVEYFIHHLHLSIVVSGTQGAHLGQTPLLGTSTDLCNNGREMQGMEGYQWQA
jgi:hypothetical protein